MAGAREEQLMDAAAMLMDARRTMKPVVDLPVGLQPVSVEEDYFVQDRLSLEYGPVGGWMVGAPTAEATPMFAPMPLAWIASNGALLRAVSNRFRGMVAEVDF